MNSKFRIILSIFLSITLLNLPFNPFVFVSGNGALPIKLSQTKDGEIWQLPNGQQVFKAGGEAPPRIYEDGIILNGTEIRSTAVNVDIESVVGSEVTYKNKNGNIAKENWFIYENGKKIFWDNFSDKNLLIRNIPMFETVSGYAVTDYEKEAIKEKTMNNIFGSLWIEYKIHEGQPLKHTLNFTATKAGTFTLCQEFSDFDYDGIVQNDVDTHTIDIIDAKQTTQKTMDVDTLSFHSKLAFGNETTVADPQLRLPEVIEFKKDGKLVLGEITSGAKQNFKSFDFDSISKTAMFCYGEFTLNSEESFIIDPDTFSSADPTVDGMVYKISLAGVQCEVATTIDTSAVILDIGAENLSGGGGCYRSYMEWNPSSIPSSSTVTNTVIKYEVKSITGTAVNCDYNAMNAAPSGGTASSIWTDVGDGTTFVSNDSTCSTVGTNKSLDLGTSADSDVQTAVTAGRTWWAVGIKMFGETRTAGANTINALASEENATPTPKPTLEITYTSKYIITYDINSFNGTALTTSTLRIKNSTNSFVITPNSTGMSKQTGVNGNQNLTITVPVTGGVMVVNKTLNYSPTATATKTINTSIYSVNCIQTGSGTDLELMPANQTISHTITNMTRPTCSTSNSQPIVISWNATFTKDGVSGASLSSLMIGTILNSSLAKNATHFFVNGTDKTVTFGGNKLTSAAFVIGQGTVSYLVKFYLWLDGTPNAPTGLTINGVTSSQVSLIWTAPSNVGVGSITGYKITRGIDGVTFGTVVVADTGSVGTTYTDSSVSASTLYYYKVQAINSYGAGTASSSTSTTTLAASSSGGSSGSGGGGGGGSTITNNLQQLLFGLEVGDISTTAKPADVLPLKIHIQYPSEKPIKVLSIDGGEFDSWITHETLPITVNTDLVEVQEHNMLPPAYAFVRNVGDIPIQLTIPQQYCNPSVGITQNCVEDKLYEIIVKLTLEFDGQTYQQNAKISLDLRQQKLSPAAIQNMIIFTILFGVAVGGATFFKKKVKGFEQSRRHRSRKTGLGKSKFEKEISRVIS